MIHPLLSRCGRWLALAVALFLLNASLTFENVWPTPNIQWGAALSLELAAGVLLLALAHRHAGAIARRVLPAAWVVLVAGRYLDVTAPGLYGREFNLYWDSQHLGAVASMLTRSTPWWMLAASAGAALLAVILVGVVAQVAWRCVAAPMAHAASRRMLAASAGLVIAAFAAQQVAAVPSPVAFADPVTPAYARQARFVLGMLGPGTVAPRLGPSPAFASPLGALGGADVLLLFVESYGAITFDVPGIADALADSREGLAAAIRDTGREVVSAYVDSPTFGGSSWLAHLSLLSGVDVRDQYAYTSLMASRRDTLVRMFARSGYRTVALMPGMRQPWPEGAFYGFDTIYGFDALAYDGPRFGWWTVPDQWALARLDALERARAGRAPLFVVFPTSTTHAPFGPVPPYQPDWSRVLTADAFDAAAVEHALATPPDLTDLRPSYVRAMAYEYTALAGYLRERRDDAVLIVVGDHQPPAAVSGPDAPWEVPVHVIGRPGPMLRRLLADGFTPGLAPRGPSLGRMHALVPMFTGAFDAADGDYLDTLNGRRVPPIANASSVPSTGSP